MSKKQIIQFEFVWAVITLVFAVIYCDYFHREWNPIYPNSQLGTDGGFNYFVFYKILFCSGLVNVSLWGIRFVIISDFFSKTNKINPVNSLGTEIDNKKVNLNSKIGGNSIENAIILPAISLMNMSNTIGEIYKTLSNMYGTQGQDWHLIEQRNIRKNERRYDEMYIKLKNGEKFSVFFDKTNVGADVEYLLEAQNYYESGVEKSEKEDYVAALKDLNLAIEINPTFADYYYVRGTINLKLNKHRDAIDDLNKSIYLNPNHGDSFYARGLMKIATNDKMGGCSDFVKADKLSHPDAMDSLEKFCR